jgi:hypothetical protein
MHVLLFAFDSLRCCISIPLPFEKMLLWFSGPVRAVAPPIQTKGTKQPTNGGA